jgi:hypothetical protein
MDTRLTFRDYRRSIKTDAGTQRVNPSAQWFQGGVKRGWEWEIRPAVCQENPLRRTVVSVPQTDTGGRDEYSQALG